LQAHYMSFYFCTKEGSAVAAGVNKAIQGTTIFSLSHLFFCPSVPGWLMQPADDGSSGLVDDAIMCTKEKLDEQCFDVSKGVAVALVAIASLVYSTRPAAAVPATADAAETSEEEGLPRGSE
jgi:hypothetical protein